MGFSVISPFEKRAGQYHYHETAEHISEPSHAPTLYSRYFCTSSRYLFPVSPAPFRSRAARIKPGSSGKARMRARIVEAIEFVSGGALAPQARHRYDTSPYQPSCSDFVVYAVGRESHLSWRLYPMHCQEMHVEVACVEKSV